ncbi:MAG: polyprenyl synthetase family protein [Caldilineaceae bacterium]|nr:polyprenyl synthetase family protein [Caldilineaceae bacterium]
MSNGELSGFIGRWLPQIEAEMNNVIGSRDNSVAAHYGMMRYHLGWADEHFHLRPAPSGKRLRPILCLLSCAELGGDPSQALPAAAAIELLHNFSLIHDDIEDGDEMRHHRPTVWKVWGMPLGINVGDGMFTLAFDAIQRLTQRGINSKATLAVLAHFTQTCLTLTEGQFLDISFEDRPVISIDEYMHMIQGKTAALIGASVAIGARIAGATSAQETDMLQFGQAMGLAFQIQDDILGIWGDPAITGKPVGSDILSRKKSLPLLHALNHPQIGDQMQGAFALPVDESQLESVMKLLEQAETRRFAEQQMANQHELALAALEAALGPRAASSPLLMLAEGLLHRTN